MMIVKVIKIDEAGIRFENNISLHSAHDQDCCENHYLSFSDLTIEDFEGLKFNLGDDKFFKRIEGYGIELIPVHGHSVKIPGYGSNNGYYSDNLELLLAQTNKPSRTFDVTECQVTTD